MLSLGTDTWIRLFGWLAAGLLLFWVYGRAHSRLARQNA
jgi:APA family basic amino acid/polyamine antiporter